MTSSTIAKVVPDDAAAFLRRTGKLLIDGAWVDAADGRTFETIDPADEQPLATVAFASLADVDKAVKAARRSFEDKRWRGLSPFERSRILYRLADLIEANRELVLNLEILDTGKPRGYAEWDFNFALECFRYFAGTPTRLAGELIPADESRHSYIRRESVGVCGQIVPWNFPFLMATWKVAPALACGNSVVLKPAEQTPLTTLLLGELALEAGVPAGVLNVLTGDGETGAAIVNHDQVDKIAFTGSTEVGKYIMSTAAQTLKHVTLELGGKSPNIIFADADLDAAVPAALSGIFGNSGQVCCAGTRLLLDRRIKDEFLERLTAAAEQLRLGHGLEPTTDMGPLISAEQLDRVRSYIDLGRSEGATLVCGGGVQSGPGFFVEPTIFTDVEPAMRIAREEIFGPVLAVLVFDTFDEAIELANDSDYGLASAVWTKDLSTAHRAAAEIEAGTVWVNCFNDVSPLTPFGGYKLSGVGRELGQVTLDAYTQTKTVVMAV